jgi:localization factor PodJL
MPMPGDNFDPVDLGQTTGSTEIAKSGHVPAMPSSEIAPEPQLASLKPMDPAAMPPGVFFTVEEPSVPGAQAKAPMPPAALGPLGLRKAASEGDATAQYEIGVRYADGKGTKRDAKKAAEWLARAGRGGLAPAQYRLAAMYERGIGVDKDLDKARAWYKAAAERGNVKAMHNLAVSVSGRNGSTPDYATAAKWYGQAAAHGLADSQFNLGILAEHGLGMTKNLSDAYKWYALAAAQGDAEATKRRDVIAVQLDPETLATTEAAVKAWKATPEQPEANTVAENPAWTAKASAKAPASEAASLVSRAQTLLNKLGYDVGPPDGLLGSRTRAEIKRFQQRNGLEETGEVTVPLVTKLEHLTS